MIPTHVGHVLLLEIPYRHLLIFVFQRKLRIVENVLQAKIQGKEFQDCDAIKTCIVFLLSQV